MEKSTVLAKIIPDKMYIQMLYFKHFKNFPDLKNPRTYNEKLQWLKLYDRKPIYTIMVDKYRVKEYVANIIGDEFIIPTIGVWERPEDIDFDSLPEQFVLKWNHDSGSIIICKNKAELNTIEAIKRLSKRAKYNGFHYGREWPYKNVKPCIIAEKYMENEETGDLRDYKFFAFNGTARAMFIATDRFEECDTKFDFFDMDYQHLPFTNGHPNADTIPTKPMQFELMKELSAKLSMGIPQVRVDWYEANGKLYFGEFTFFHWSGFKPFVPNEWDYTFGSWIELPPKTKS